MIRKHTPDFSVKMMCKLLSVSSSGYYDWRDRPASHRAQKNAELSIKIKTLFDKERGRSGAKRIAKRLKQEGITIGRHRVARIMQLNGWRAKAAKKFKATTNSNHTLPVSPNLLQQNFSASRPNEKWVSAGETHLNLPNHTRQVQQASACLPLFSSNTSFE